MTNNLLDHDLEGLTAYCEQLGEKRFRATQLFRWIHQKGATDFDQMTDLAARFASRPRPVALWAAVFALPVTKASVET